MYTAPQGLILSGNGYGRKKISSIAKGIKKIAEGDASLKDIVAELKTVNDEERLYHQIHTAIKERMRSFFSGVDSKKVKDRIREGISEELAEKGINEEITKRLFDKVFLDLEKESFYLNHLLPLIIQNNDITLREDFIKNSGLDRFYIEILEKEYFEKKELDRTFLESLLVGGGERI